MDKGGGSSSGGKKRGRDEPRQKEIADLRSLFIDPQVASSKKPLPHQEKRRKSDGDDNNSKASPSGTSSTTKHATNSESSSSSKHQQQHQSRNKGGTSTGDTNNNKEQQQPQSTSRNSSRHPTPKPSSHILGQNNNTGANNEDRRTNDQQKKKKSSEETVGNELQQGGKKQQQQPESSGESSTGKKVLCSSTLLLRSGLFDGNNTMMRGGTFTKEDRDRQVKLYDQQRLHMPAMAFDEPELGSNGCTSTRFLKMGWTNGHELPRLIGYTVEKRHIQTVSHGKPLVGQEIKLMFDPHSSDVLSVLAWSSNIDKVKDITPGTIVVMFNAPIRSQQHLPHAQWSGRFDYTAACNRNTTVITHAHNVVKSAQFKAITLGNAVHMVDTPKLKEHTDASSADEMALAAIEDDDDDTMGANELQPAPKEEPIIVDIDDIDDEVLLGDAAAQCSSSSAVIRHVCKGEEGDVESSSGDEHEGDHQDVGTARPQRATAVMARQRIGAIASAEANDAVDVVVGNARLVDVLTPQQLQARRRRRRRRAQQVSHEQDRTVQQRLKGKDAQMYRDEALTMDEVLEEDGVEWSSDDLDDEEEEWETGLPLSQRDMMLSFATSMMTAIPEKEMCRAELDDEQRMNISCLMCGDFLLNTEILSFPCECSPLHTRCALDCLRRDAHCPFCGKHVETGKLKPMPKDAPSSSNAMH